MKTKANERGGRLRAGKTVGRRRSVVGALAATVLLAGSGCAELGTATQALQTTMAIKEHFDKQAERAMSGGVPIDALNDMVDEMASFLARELPNQQEVRESEYQFVLAIGDIVKKGDQTENPGLDVALRSIETKLTQNPQIRESFVVISTTYSQAEQIVGQLSGNTSGFDDPLQTGGGSGGSPVKYHPASIYLVSGEFIRYVDKQNKRLSITMPVRFTHPQSSRIVLAKDFRRDYKLKGGKWVAEG